MSLARLMTTEREIEQHLAWMRQYLAVMNERNWRDMQTMMERQLDKLEPLITLPKHTAG